MDHSITPSTIAARFDAATLTPAQLDGLACITCGRDDQPMKPVEVRNGVQVFECVDHDQPLTARNLSAVMCAVAHNPTPVLTDREVGLIFRIGSMSSVVIADELGVDVRDFGVSDVQDMLSAQELNALVLFVRDLLGRRQAGAA